MCECKTEQLCWLRCRDLGVARMGTANPASQPCWDRDRDGVTSACMSRHTWSCTRIRTEMLSLVTCNGALMPRCKESQ